MKRKWLRLLVAVPLLAVLCFTNIYQDPANIFHNDSKQIADALLSGSAAYIGSGNGNEREIKRYLIEGMPKHVDCLAIGPSLSMGIRSEDTGSGSFYNLSVNGLQFYDLMAFFGFLQINQVSFDRLILCVDTLCFDDYFVIDSMRNSEMIPYAEYMLAFLDGKDPAPVVENTAEQRRTLFEQAFSITYFQAACDQIRSNQSYLLTSRRWGIVDESTKDLAYFLPDGSRVDKAGSQARTAEDVIRDVNEYDPESHFSIGRHANETNKQYIIKLIDYLQSSNVSVEFFLHPIAPALWDRIYSSKDASLYYLIPETEEFARQLAAEKGIQTIGAYNPHIVGVTDEDFWDARHMKHDSLIQSFDFRTR